MAEFDHRSQGWPHTRHFVVARRFIPDEEAAWVTNMDLTSTGVWHFYDGRA